MIIYPLKVDVNTKSEFFNKRVEIISLSVYNLAIAYRRAVIMRQYDTKDIFSKNLNKLLRDREKTQLDIAKALGVSSSTVSSWCTGEKMPRMDKVERLAEYFRVVKSYLLEENILPQNVFQPPSMYKVPRLGQIACGAPILAEEHIESYDDVPGDIKCDFTLLCKGDSMTGAGIEDGDIVYIREQPEVENGEIAAVIVGEDEATLKRFKRAGDIVLLIPENAKYEPMVFSGEEMNRIRIVGKAVGFTRIF